MLKGIFSYISGILDTYCNPTGDESPLKVDVRSDNQHLQEKLEYAYKCYKSEHIRRRRIETKSSIFIGTIGVLSTIIVGGITRLFLGIGKFNSFEYSLIFALFLTTIPILVSVYYALKALHKAKCSYIEISDFRSYQGEEFYNRLIDVLNEAIEDNIPVAEEKAKYMHKAQISFLVALVIMSFYAFIISLIYIFIMGINFLEYLDKVSTAFSKIDINQTLVIVLIILTIISLLLSIVALYKTKRNNINGFSKK